MSKKIIHIDGGLGNQMCCYANYISARESNPGDDLFFEKLAYSISETDESVCQWNGYELEKVFGIHVPDILDLFDLNERKTVIEDLRATRFWENGWFLRKNVVDVLRKHGLEFNDLSVSTGITSRHGSFYDKIRKFVISPSKNIIEYKIKSTILKHKNVQDNSVLKGEYYQKRDGNCFYSINLEFMKSRFLQQKLGDKVRNELVFCPIDDENNLKALDIINKTNSVSIHARRSDFLQYNNDCYRFGYFKKATAFIKSNVSNPVFFIFSEESDWCRKNLKTLGLNANKDKIYFVDWNGGAASFRDMQLMSQCKHNIATKSSFGWWAAFLNKNPDKITISQFSPYITTHQF